MTDADRAAFSNAFSAATKRAEAKGEKIDHVIWRDGSLTITTTPKTAEVPLELDQGSLL